MSIFFFFVITGIWTVLVMNYDRIIMIDLYIKLFDCFILLNSFQLLDKRYTYFCLCSF